MHVPPFIPSVIVQGRSSIVPLPAAPRRRVILLADDDEDIRGLLAFILARAGFEVRETADGDEAVTVAPLLRPDAALLNNLMPKTDGVLACGRLRRTPCLDGLPIVVYSGCSLTRFRPAALEAGAWACWEMPLSSQEFVRRTNAVLAGQGRDPEAPGR